MNAREDAAHRRQLAEYERRRRHRRKLIAAFLILVLIAAAVAGTVWLAVVRNADPEEGSGSRRRRDKDVQTGEVQVPDWVTQDLLPVNEYSRPGTELEHVNGVVVHYVGNPGTTAQQNRNYFANLAETHETSASSHFVIGLEGEIIQCVPLDEWSYCSNKRNEDTIAIECCHPDESGVFTEATQESLVKLLKWLCETYDLDREDVIRHYDVTGKICPKWYVDDPAAWEDLKDRVFGPDTRPSGDEPEDGEDDEDGPRDAIDRLIGIFS